MNHILKCALAGGAFSASAVIAGSITWTLVQARQDKRHMVEYWQRRQLEEAQALHPASVVLPFVDQRVASDAA